MDKTKAVELMKKAMGCLQTDPKDCPSKCSLCKNHATKEDGIEALVMALKALEREQATIISGSTLTIKVSEEDIDKIKRIMLDCSPWCRVFYEEGGEAHWIKSDTPDGGEIYECDNCGVAWAFNEGGPEENEAFFCPKCGFKMVPKEE